LDRIEIRPGPRELPEDSLEKFRQKEPSADIYPKEPNRPNVVRRPGIISEADPGHVPQSKAALRNHQRANEQLARLHKERDASHQATSASRDALLQHENEVRLSYDPATREAHKQQLKHISEPSTSNPEKYFERQFASTPQRLTDVSRQTLSASTDALPQRENAVTISSDPAIRENLRRTGQRDLDITRTDYQEIGRGLKREELKREFKETALEVTGRGNDDPGRGNGPDIPPPPPPGGPGAGPKRPSPEPAVAMLIPQGFDQRVLATATARNPETSRDALNQHIERTDNAARTEMHQAAREALRRHMDEPVRPQEPQQDRSRGLER
jgi:hypothetical protein